MTIEAWYKLHAPSYRNRYADPEGDLRTGMPFGVIPDGLTLREGDGHTRLAEFMRHADSGRKPLVRLILPNQLTIGRHREIRDAVLKAGGVVFSVPMNVLSIAEIDSSTINVLDTKFSVHAFRADEQLIEATVNSPVWRRDTWGFLQHDHYEKRQARFLSGYDRNEKGLSYFFCELPVDAKPTTVEEAYEALKPPSVKEAERLGLKVRRQGDMFFIRMKGWEPKDGDYHEPGSYIHNSNHLAEDVVRTTDGLTYVRGSIAHRPSGRRPDHASLNLGRTHYWLCVRNTVPVVR